MPTASLTDVSLTLPPVAEVVRVLALQAGFNTAVVVCGSMFLGIAGGVVGSFSLLRKRALIGDALAHSALPGLALAFLVGFAIGFEEKSLILLLAGALGTGILGVLCIHALVQHTRLDEDAAIGSVLSGFFGLGVVLLSVIQNMGTGSEGGLGHFIYGQTSAMGFGDAVLTGGAALVAIVGALLLLKEFRLVCFDADFAAVQGWPVGRIDLMMMALVVLVTVIGLQAVGLILVIALLIVPPVAARFWTESLAKMVFLAGLFGGISGYLGSSLSALLPRFPAGSVIVLTSGVIFLLSFFLAPSRGLLFGVFKLLRLSLNVNRDHLLRKSYEYLETNYEGMGQAIPTSALHFSNGWRWGEKWLLFWLLKWQGLLTSPNATEFLLSNKGMEEAFRLTRNHRLWEEYLLGYGNVRQSHVDFSADFVEHVLSAEVVKHLEQALADKGTLPAELGQLRSVHNLGQL